MYQPIKPNAAFYLIPIFTFIGGIVLFFVIMVASVANMYAAQEDYDIGEEKIFNVTGPKTIFLMIENSLAEDVKLDYIDDNHYRVSLANDVSIEFTIVNRDDPEMVIDVEKDEYNEDLAYEEESPFLIFNFSDEGHYVLSTVRTAANEDLILTLTDFDVYSIFKSVLLGFLSIVIGTLISIISLIIIIVKRSNYKRMLAFENSQHVISAPASDYYRRPEEDNSDHR